MTRALYHPTDIIRAAVAVSTLIFVSVGYQMRLGLDIGCVSLATIRRRCSGHRRASSVASDGHSMAAIGIGTGNDNASDKRQSLNHVASIVPLPFTGAALA